MSSPTTFATATATAQTRRQRVLSLTLGAAFVVALVAANLLTSHFGLIPAGFGLSVTAGTYTAGLALAVRDSLQNTAGLRVVVTTMIVGLGLSALTADPHIVAASVAASAVAETTDLAVYTPLRTHGQRRALGASCAVGALTDTLLFLAVAGFPLTTRAIVGQLLVKAVWVSCTYLLIREGVVRVVSRQRQHAGHPRGDASRRAGPAVQPRRAPGPAAQHHLRPGQRLLRPGLGRPGEMVGVAGPVVPPRRPVPVRHRPGRRR